jgi:hypothetical protein
MPSWPDEYHYNPCDRCGYATRYKQFDLCCACTTPDRCPHPPYYRQGDHCTRCGGDARVRRESMYGKERLQEIWAEQEQKNAALAARATDPTRLGVAPRYAKGIAHPSDPQE